MTDAPSWRRRANDFRSLLDPPEGRMSATHAPLGWGDPTRMRWLPDAEQDESKQRFELVAAKARHAKWRLDGGKDGSERERFKLFAANAEARCERPAAGVTMDRQTQHREGRATARHRVRTVRGHDGGGVSEG
jgi:hypothetical protein